MVDILLKRHIIGYFRYVDDILIAYKKDTTHIYDVLNMFNNTMPTMKFAMEEQEENKINFLDINISKEENNISFDIYRKPTTTDTVNLKHSCHPQEHKLAAIR
jgi:hypothetical protein